MGEYSKIEWCHHTFNPWVGCTKVSSACDHCYAESWAKRAGNPELWHGERRRTSDANWRLPIKWNRKAEADGVRYRVFCASLADVFDNQVPTEWRDDLWALIRQAPNLDWLLLTKRPQNIKKMLPQFWPLPNVWLGTTAENQAEYDRRWPILRETTATIRFISYEPALGLIYDINHGAKPLPDWVIMGGESGPHARHMEPMWARQTRNVCGALGIAFFMKQMARKTPIPDDLLVREFPGVRTP